MPGLEREALDRHVLELRRLLDEELGDGVRVTADLAGCRDVLLDQREAALGLRDLEQPEEERALVPRVDDSDGKRLFELHALRHDDEEAVVPDRCVVRGELLARADQPAEALVVRKRLKGDAIRRAAVDRNAVLTDQS